jgi:hypothetical protein
MDSMVVFLFSGVIIVGLGLIVLMGFGRRGAKGLNREEFQRDWLAIEAAVGTDSNSQQFAILQADKLLDKALRDGGYAGTTMAERLTSASRVFRNREAVWAAHKFRNRIAHEQNITINAQWTKKALNSFKKGLKDLGAL